MSDFRRDGLQTAASAMRPLANTRQRILFVGTCLLLAASLSFGQVADASDNHVLSEIVGESTVGENVLALRDKLADRSSDDRFETLSNWVLPGKGHQHFRIQGTYTPTNSKASMPPDDSQAVEQLKFAASEELSRLQIGGNIVSPVFDLVEVAKELDRLNELRSHVEKIETPDGSDLRAKLSLLFMIDVAKNNDSAATKSATQLFDIFRASDHADVSERWPETLAMAYGVRHAAHLKIVSELLYMNYEKFVNDLHDWRKLGNDAWDGHFFSLIGKHRLRESDDDAANNIAIPPGLNNWAPVSRFTASSRGRGLAHSLWNWDGNQVSKDSGHDQDYLMFRSPLQGNFEVECEVSSTDWQKMELLTAGRWIGTYWNRKAFEIGNVRFQRPNVSLEKPMAKFREWSRYRVVVRDGTYSMFFNGRQLHEEQIGDTFDPWIAIRGRARSLGAVRDLRITGAPVVPEAVVLAAKKALPGWTSYYHAAVSDDGDWRHEIDNGTFGIVGRRQPELAGSFNESLLSYHRPMLEDGTIEYDFFYEPGQSHIHPAMDRLTFLLDPAGVDEHWATDGPYERSGLSPANRSTKPENRRGDGSLPLKMQAWNRLTFTLHGDTVLLELNGEPIYERKLEATNQRTFGLFHYSDRTEARVRNIVWRGDWPKQVSPSREQELFLPDHKCLDGLELLTETFTHDFTDELPENELTFSGASAAQAISSTDNGIRVKPPIQQKWIGVRVEYSKPIYGDFDATLKFEMLGTSYGTAGSNELMLLANDESGITIRTSTSQYADERSYASCVMTLPLPDGKKRYVKRGVVDETGSGTLRIVRRGATVHSLVACGDSPNFRYIANHELPSAASAVEFAVIASQNGGGSADVVLREVSVRSNTTAFESKVDARVTSLNQFISSLPRTHRHGFAASGTDGFALVGDMAPVKGNGGLRVRAGNDPQTGGTTLNSGKQPEGDFDLSATLNASGLTTSESVSGEASMSVRSENEQAMLSIRRSGEESFDVTATVQRTGSSGPQAETIASETVSSVDSLRLVRIQKTILFVYSEGGLSRLLGQASFSSAPVSDGGIGLRIEPQSGEVLWKSFEARMSASGK